MPTRKPATTTPVAASSERADDTSVEFIDTRYARTDDGVHLAYNVLEGGPIDLMYFHGFLGNLEVLWEFEGIRSLMRKLWRRSRARPARSAAPRQS
jgi:hypothetical protein